MNDKPIVLAMTGASGAQYGLRLLEVLLGSGRSVYLLVSRPARVVLGTETDLNVPGRPAEMERFFRDRFAARALDVEVDAARRAEDHVDQHAVAPRLEQPGRVDLLGGEPGAGQGVARVTPYVSSRSVNWSSTASTRQRTTHGSSTNHASSMSTTPLPTGISTRLRRKKRRFTTRI